MSDCPSCGGALAPDDKFCASCGAPVPEPASAPEPPETPACAACGGEIAADARFCGHCGAAVAGVNEPTVVAQPTAVDEPTLVAEEPTVVDGPTPVAEEPTLVAEAPTEVVTPAPAGAHSSRKKKIAIIAGVVAVAAAIAGVVLWRGGDDPSPPQTSSDASTPAYEYTYDETTPATGYDDSSGSEAVPDMEADALTTESLYGVWSGTLYVEKEMAYGDRWRKSDLEYQTAYISIAPYENGTYGEFTVEPTSGDAFSGEVTDITIEDDVATIRIEYTSLNAGASLRLSLQNGYDLVGFYADDRPPDSNWVSWKGTVELPRLMGE